MKPNQQRKPHFVLDTSVSAAWVLSKQSTPYKLAVLTALDTQTALVPALWHAEMSNILCKFAKQNQADMATLEIHISLLGVLSIQTDEWLTTSVQRQKSGSLRALTQGAMLHGITSYDTQYLMLAMREDLPLASADEALCCAARRAGIAIYQP